jgi:hypothetical protein
MTDRDGFSFAAFVVIVCGALIIGAIWYAVSRPWSGVTTYSAGKCIEAGGVVVDTFNNQDAAFTSSRFLGEVEGLQCPCVCMAREELAD